MFPVRERELNPRVWRLPQTGGTLTHTHSSISPCVVDYTAGGEREREAVAFTAAPGPTRTQPNSSPPAAKFHSDRRETHVPVVINRCVNTQRETVAFLHKDRPHNPLSSSPHTPILPRTQEPIETYGIPQAGGTHTPVHRTDRHWSGREGRLRLFKLPGSNSSPDAR